MRIEPTVGRVIHYYPAAQHPDHGQVCAAIIAHVNADGTLNLAVFDCAGHHYSRKHVELVQDDDHGASTEPYYEAGNYARWMPYQVGQAQKTEQAERALVESNQSSNIADLRRFSAPVTAVANVGQLVNYIPSKGGFPVPARIVNKHSDLLVDLVELLIGGGDGPLHTSVHAFEHYEEGPDLGHYCTLCDPVDTSIPVLGATNEAARPAASSVDLVGIKPSVGDTQEATAD